MRKQNYANKETRSQNTSIASARTPVKIVGNHGLANVDLANDDLSTDAVAASQSSPDTNGAGRLSPRDKLTGFAMGNRIKFSDADDLGLTAAPRKVVSARRRPISFARQLAAAPTRHPVVVPLPSLPVRARQLFLEIIRRVSKRLSQRHSRRRKLQLLEIQQLGEKRFIAIVRVGKEKFLIGGAATSVSLLAEIDSHKDTVNAPRLLDPETA